MAEERTTSASEDILEGIYNDDYKKYDGLCNKKYSHDLTPVHGKAGYDCVACKDDKDNEVDFAKLEIEDKGEDANPEDKKARSRSRSGEKSPKAHEPLIHPAHVEPSGTTETFKQKRRRLLKELKDKTKEFEDIITDLITERSTHSEDEKEEEIDDLKTKLLKGLINLNAWYSNATEENPDNVHKYDTMDYDEIEVKIREAIDEKYPDSEGGRSPKSIRRKNKKKKRKTKRKKSYWFF